MTLRLRAKMLPFDTGRIPQRVLPLAKDCMHESDLSERHRESGRDRHAKQQLET